MFRAVIYARCSTEEERQKNALLNQVEEAKAEVYKNGWLLVDSYIELKSGTTTDKRTEYTRLFEDLLMDKFDVIVIKSQDRLMRNTKDWYLFVDRLCTSNKKLYIYMEQKYYTPDDALITGIKAILAEEYSRDLSKKINNAHRHRQESGSAVILTARTYGYRRLPDKTIVIDEEEARIKRKMYELCAAGYGCRSISTILKNEGVVNRVGKPFNDAAILKMIRSPLNKGTVVMNKKHYDFTTKKVIKVPEDEQYIHKNRVPAIVSEELWELANEQISNRTSRKKKPSDVQGYTGKNTGGSILSGKIYCGLCKSPYYHKVRRRYKNNEKIYEWKCKTYLSVGRDKGDKMRPQIRKVPLDNIQGCNNIHIEEKELMKLLENVCQNRYKTDKSRIIQKMVQVLKAAFKQSDFSKELSYQQEKKEKTQKKISVLADKLLEGIISDEIYQRKQKELEEELSVIQENIRKLELQNVRGNQIQDRISSIEKQLSQGNLVENATVAEMLREVDRIYIYPEYMEILFNIDKMLDLEGTKLHMDRDSEVVRIEFGSRFNFYALKKESRDVVVEMMRNNPQITARQIAESLGISMSGINYRINILKKEGRIYFSGKGGKGKWIINE